MPHKLLNLLQDSAQEPGVFMRVLNYLAAALGIASFLNLVNLIVGVLSAVWLGAQLWAHYRYGLPYKRAQLALAQRQLERGGDQTPRGDLRDDESS